MARHNLTLENVEATAPQPLVTLTHYVTINYRKTYVHVSLTDVEINGKAYRREHLTVVVPFKDGPQFTPYVEYPHGLTDAAARTVAGWLDEAGLLPRISALTALDMAQEKVLREADYARRQADREEESRLADIERQRQKIAAPD